MKRLSITLAVLAGLLIAAPAALAHHVESSTSWATCTQVGAKLVGFSYNDGPVNWTARVDGSVVKTGTEPKFSGDKTIVVNLPVLSKGTHTISFSATWPTQGSNNGTFTKTVYNCPGPPPPPVYDCEGNPLPPGSTPPTPEQCNPPVPPTPPNPPVPPVPPNPPVPPKPPKPPVPPNECPKRTDYTVTKPPSSVTHGVVRFKVSGDTLRTHRNIKRIHWFIAGKRVRDENAASLDITRRTLKIALWRSDIWTRHNIYGTYRVKWIARTKTGCKVVGSFVYFNQDPPKGVVIINGRAVSVR